jgi:hypothetical protein
VATGLLTLDEQAKALGLARSTAWTIVRANHKNSGLSATTVNRILMSPRLPPLVRATILEYVEQKIAGLYGHGKRQQRKFAARLMVEQDERAKCLSRDTLSHVNGGDLTG